MLPAVAAGLLALRPRSGRARRCWRSPGVEPPGPHDPRVARRRTAPHLVPWWCWSPASDSTPAPGPRSGHAYGPERRRSAALDGSSRRTRDRPACRAAEPAADRRPAFRAVTSSSSGTPRAARWWWTWPRGRAGLSGSCWSPRSPIRRPGRGPGCSASGSARRHTSTPGRSPPLAAVPVHRARRRCCADMNQMHRYRTQAGLSMLSVPTHIIRGKNDRFVASARWCARWRAPH